MPLLITPSEPLITPSGLSITVLYCIVNRVGFDRLQRRGEFTVGYYINEDASLPDSGVHQLPVDLLRDFSFAILPEQANAADAQAVCEAYAQHELAKLLPGATIEEVP